MILMTEQGRVTDTNANGSKQVLINKLAQILEHDKAVTFLQTGNDLH